MLSPLLSFFAQVLCNHILFAYPLNCILGARAALDVSSYTMDRHWCHRKWLLVNMLRVTNRTGCSCPVEQRDRSPFIVPGKRDNKTSFKSCHSRWNAPIKTVGSFQAVFPCRHHWQSTVYIFLVLIDWKPYQFGLK